MDQRPVLLVCQPVRARTGQGLGRRCPQQRQRGEDAFIANRGDLIQPRTGKPQPPAPLDGQAIESDSPEDRREALAEWLTAPENPYFTRSIANRVWANFFGRGIVEPVDDLRVSNPASNEPLLEAISAHLVENRYDLKALMRLILQSETYQRAPARRSRKTWGIRNITRATTHAG